MEDMFQQRQMSSNYAFFGIFDGHAGCRAAQWLCDHLANRVETTIASQQDHSPPAMEASMKSAFLQVDEEFVNEAVQGKWHDGSTCVVVMVRGRELVVCNTGDSRAVLSRLGQAQAMSEDHKPNHPVERERIIRCGGTIDVVGVPRINGVLATSRTFGDGAFKVKQIVTAEPDVRCKEIQPGDEFIIIASDGLWDVLSNQDACAIAARAGTAKEAARLLVEEALSRGTKDNVTAGVIDLAAAAGAPYFRGVERTSSNSSSPKAAPELPFSSQMLLTTASSYSGWLRKQQSKKNLFGTRSWQQRWYSIFRVDQAVDFDASVHREWSMSAVVIGYHGSREQAQGRSVIPKRPTVLQPEYLARREASHDSKGLMFFSVQDASDARVVLLGCETESECQAWIAAINAALKGLASSTTAGGH